MSELEQAFLNWINAQDLFNQRQRAIIARQFAEIARRFGAKESTDDLTR